MDTFWNPIYRRLGADDSDDGDTSSTDVENDDTPVEPQSNVSASGASGGIPPLDKTHKTPRQPPSRGQPLQSHASGRQSNMPLGPHSRRGEAPLQDRPLPPIPGGALMRDLVVHGSASSSSSDGSDAYHEIDLGEEGACGMDDIYEEDKKSPLDLGPDVRRKEKTVEKKTTKKKYPHTPKMPKLPTVRQMGDGIRQLLRMSDTLKVSDQHESAQVRESTGPPLSILRPSDHPEYKDVYCMYLEGTMGAGKTTLLSSTDTFLGDQVVVKFPEMMHFWKTVFTDCHLGVFEQLRSKKPEMSSFKILAHQMKFMTPMKFLARSIYRNQLDLDGVPVLDQRPHWCLFDRHLISPSVVFPITQYKCGHLSGEHLFTLLSTFEAHDADLVVFLDISTMDAVRRIQMRNREGENKIKAKFVSEVNRSYRQIYHAWTLLKFLSAEDIVEILVTGTNVQEYCIEKGLFVGKQHQIELMYKSSIFPIIGNIVSPYGNDCTIIEGCFSLCRQLQKICLIKVDVSQFNYDIPGLWGNIYSQMMRRSSIKLQRVDWCTIKEIARAYNSQ
ncbi:thymidine kinase [Marmot herpesvirus 1]|nr:thymidine kinase [Marmot herpesvirus 1]